MAAGAIGAKTGGPVWEAGTLHKSTLGLGEHSVTNQMVSFLCDEFAKTLNFWVTLLV